MSLYCNEPDCTNLPERNGKCATHNHRNRKAEREALKPIKTYKIPKVSEAKKKVNAEKNHVYKKMAALLPHHCSGCGCKDQLTHSHILPVGQYPELETTFENIVYDCIRCHDIWEHGTFEQCQQLANYQHRINIIKALRPEYLLRMLLNSEKAVKTAKNSG